MENMEGILAGKRIVVTGATSGIGLAAAEELLGMGASIVGVGRSEQRCREAEKRLHAIDPEAQVTYCLADLSLQSQVKKLAQDIRKIISSNGKSSLDGLINDAGTFTYWMTLTPEGFETQWAVNYLAPFLLTHELLPLLQAAPLARVVTVSSGSHYSARMNWEDIQLRHHYNGLKAYGQTKLANVLFTLALNRRLGEDSTIRAFAADPGLVKTDIGLKNTPALARWVWLRRRSGGIKPEESAKGVVYLVSEPSIQDSQEIYWKHCKAKPASKRALDISDAERLWRLSEQMCGIKTENNHE
jgi:NAD(P)-dependent dehydrogenase (short-subunit alcohol dehydrogenase family)